MLKLKWKSRFLTSDILYIALAESQLHPLPLHSIYFFMSGIPPQRRVDRTAELLYEGMPLSFFFRDLDNSVVKFLTR